MAWTGSGWVLLSFSLFPARHPGADPGRDIKEIKLGQYHWLIIEKFDTLLLSVLPINRSLNILLGKVHTVRPLAKPYYGLGVDFLPLFTWAVGPVGKKNKLQSPTIRRALRYVILRHGSKWVAPFHSGGIFRGSYGVIFKIRWKITPYEEGLLFYYLFNFKWPYKNTSTIRKDNLFLSLYSAPRPDGKYDAGFTQLPCRTVRLKVGPCICFYSKFSFNAVGVLNKN